MTKQTKADVVRSIIKANKAKGKDAVVALVIGKKILSKALSRTYVLNNWDDKPKAKAAKKVAKKTTSKKKTEQVATAQ